MTSFFGAELHIPGHEIGRLEALSDGWELSGTAIFTYERSPCKLDYIVDCDSIWQTKSARVKGVIGAREVNLSITLSENRRWYLNGVNCPSVAGCTDIDLGFSPSTNLLPIRRLSLAVGEEEEVRAAWLPFPSLKFELLPQLYRRERERMYRYESAGGRFVRVLEVNAAGFVTNYPDLWQAESVTQQTS